MLLAIIGLERSVIDLLLVRIELKRSLIEIVTSHNFDWRALLLICY